MPNDKNKRVQPTLEMLQDVYTHLLDDCQVQVSAQPGEVLNTVDDHVWELHLHEKFVNNRGGFRTILRDGHLAALYRLRNIGEYFQGEYKPASEEDEEFVEEFKSVWPEFLEGGYWRTIWVGYGEDLVELEKQQLKEQQLPYKINKCKFFSKWRIYKRVDAENNLANELGVYTSVLSGVTGLKIQNERLLACSCNDGANGVQWGKLVGEYNAGAQKFLGSYEACIKRLSVVVSNPEAFKGEKSQLKNNKIYVVKYKDQTRGANNNKDKPVEIVPVDHPLQILNTNQAYFETEAAWLGYSGKGMNNKTERLTAAENYENMKHVSNIQECNLSKLNNIAGRMRKQFPHVPEDFRFEVTGQTLAMGLPQSMNAGMPGGGINGVPQPTSPQQPPNVQPPKKR